MINYKYYVICVDLPEWCTGSYELIEAFDSAKDAFELKGYLEENNQGEWFCIVEVDNE